MPHFSPKPMPKPLDSARLEELALAYVARFATSAGKLEAYLRRKLRERGWAGEGEPPVARLVGRFVAAGYVDDRAYAESKAGAMGRRGLGARRIGEALRVAGVAAEDAEAVAPIVEDDRLTSAITFARRKRIGPYAREAADRPLVEKHVAAMVRAGHAPRLARRIARMAPGEDAEALLEGEADRFA